MQQEQIVIEVVKFLVGQGLLGVVLYFIIAGKLKTEPHHEEVVRLLEASEKRAWEAADEAKEALAANNEVMKQLSGSVQNLTDAVNVSLRRR